MISYHRSDCSSNEDSYRARSQVDTHKYLHLFKLHHLPKNARHVTLNDSPGAQDVVNVERNTKQVVGWTQFGDFDLFFHGNGKDGKTS